MGRAFSDAATELALAGYPGLHLTSLPTAGSTHGVYWRTLVPADLVIPEVVHTGGRRVAVPHTAYLVTGESDPVDEEATPAAVPAAGPTEHLPLGTIIGARSGDKGGNANVGLWARSDAGWAWLDAFLTVDRFRSLLPEADDLVVQRFGFPKLRAINFVVVGLLGEGVASSTRPDPQAKSLGEYLRSRLVDIPVSLLPDRADPPERPKE